MRILLAAHSVCSTRLAARTVSRLALSAEDEIVVLVTVARPVVYGAWAYGPAVAAPSPMLIEESWKAAREGARSAMQEADYALRSVPCTVRQVVRVGHPLDVLRPAIRQLGADILVIAEDFAVSREDLASLLGNVDVPILVARGPAVTFERVLLAFDGSEASRLAAQILGRLPLSSEARIDVFVCGGDGSAPRGGLRRAFQLFRHETDDPARVASDGVAAVQRSGRMATPVIRYGDAHHEVIAAARQRATQLVVTGNRGLGPLQRAIFGSLSRTVTRKAPCSVLVAAAEPRTAA